MTLVCAMSIEATSNSYTVGSPTGRSTGFGASGTTGVGVRGNRQFMLANGFSAQFLPNVKNALGATGDSVIFGFALNKTNAASIVTFFDQSNAIVFSLARTSTGAMTVNSSAGTVLATTAGTPLSVAGWHYVEVKFTYVNSTTSTITLNVDGVQAYTGSLNLGTHNANTVVGMQVDNAVNSVMDFYCLNSQGSASNDFIGDCRVEHLVATSEGGDTGWTLGAGASKTAAVTTPADANTSYIRTTAASTRQTFVLSDLANTSGTVKGVTVMSTSWGETNGVQKVPGVVRTGGASYDSADYQLAPNGSYGATGGNFDVNPATGVAWTATEINALEAGVVVLP